MNALLFILVMLVLLWVLLIAPQRRRQQAQQRMLAEVKTGDEVLTAGGLYATVLDTDDERLLVELAPGTSVRLDRRAVAQVLTEDAGAPEEQPEPPEPVLEAAGDEAAAPEEPSSAQRT